MKQKQSEFLCIKENLLEERRRKKLHVTVEDVKSMMKTILVSENDNDKPGGTNVDTNKVSNDDDYSRENSRHNDQPIVFNVYSKYMKQDMEYLIRESIRRDEEEQTRFLTQLNSTSSANFKRRRHKRISQNTHAILRSRFGASLNFYNHLH